MNLELKTAVLRAGIPQYEVARRVGISETRLSRLVQGRVRPTDDEQRRLRAVLGVEPNETTGSCELSTAAINS